MPNTSMGVDTNKAGASSSLDKRVGLVGLEGLQGDRDLVERAALGMDDESRRSLALKLVWSLPRHDIVKLSKTIAKNLQKDIVAALPLEVSVTILAELSVQDVISCSLVSRAWAQRCADQGLWHKLCLQHDPPIRPADTTWADLRIHRVLMNAPPQPSTKPEGDGEGGMYHAESMDPITGQGGLGGGGGIGPLGLRALRRSVYERSGPGGTLPNYVHPQQPTLQTASENETHAEPHRGHFLASDLGVPDPTPAVNYKHLYITHLKLLRRMRDPFVALDPSLPNTGAPPKSYVTVNMLDAISSIHAGGLPGHSETVYSVELVFHRMEITVDSTQWGEGVLDGPYGSLMTLSRMSRGSASAHAQPVALEKISGRDWILSSSRDHTLRLWALSTTRPRVVKIFKNGHEGSVLSIFTFKVPPVDSETAAGGRKSKLMAVSGGADGMICLWDIEGDGDQPVRRVHAHGDSVLCVRGNAQQLVSCSRDHTIRVFTLPGLEEVLTIPNTLNEAGRGAVNAVSLSGDYIVSGAGDKYLKVWCLHTGREVASLDAHSRGIACVAFEPTDEPYDSPNVKRGHGTLLGTIVTGSSDSSIKIFDLVGYPRRLTDRDQVSFEEMIEDRLSFDQVEEGALAVRLEKRATCVAPCVCPSGLARREGQRCRRCLNRGHLELVRSVCLTSDVLLSSSYDGSVRIWDRDTGRALANLGGCHTGRVFSVSGNRTRIVSSGLDCRITVWDFGRGLDTAFIDP